MPIWTFSGFGGGWWGELSRHLFKCWSARFFGASPSLGRYEKIVFGERRGGASDEFVLSRTRAEHAPLENDQEPSLLCPGRNPGSTLQLRHRPMTQLDYTAHRTRLRHGPQSPSLIIFIWKYDVGKSAISIKNQPRGVAADPKARYPRKTASQLLTISMQISRDSQYFSLRIVFSRAYKEAVKYSYRGWKTVTKRSVTR